MLSLRKSRKALTKIQTIVIIAVIAIAGIAGAAFYYLYGIGGSAVTTVKIGAVIPITGAQAAMAARTVQGINLAVEVWNKNGGFKSLGGVNVTVAYGDCMMETSKASSETERLITVENVSALISPFVSSLTLVATDIAERYKVPMICANPLADSITERGFNYTFRTQVKNTAWATQAIDFVYQQLGARSVAFVYENTDFGTSSMIPAKARALSLGMNVLLAEAYSANSVDLTPVVTKVKAANPEILACISYLSDSLLLMRQMREMDCNVKAIISIGGGGFVVPEFITQGGNNSEYCFLNQNWSPDMASTGIAEFNAAFKAKYNEDPNQMAVQNYATVMVLLDAINRAASKDPVKIRDALRATSLETIVGKIQFDATGQSGANLLVLQILKGRMTTVFPTAYANKSWVYPLPSWDQR